jgi:uncharacterized protein (TIGR00369 family)
MNQTQVDDSVEPGNQGAPASRRRTYDWQDPGPGLRRLPVTSGADLLRAMERGELPVPPLAATLDFERFVVVDEGTVELTLVPGEHHLNPIGTVHGGVIAAMLDTVAGCAVHSVLPAGTGYTSLDLHTRFLRAVTPATGRVRAVGTVVTRGSRTATAEARLVDGRDRLLATATSTCLVFDLT